MANSSRGENGDGAVLSTPVKRVVDEHWETGKLFLGACSNYLCDLEEGETAKLTGPTGRHFLLPPVEALNDHSYVFLAAGTGIAPFRGMVQELLDFGVKRDIWLIFGVPYFTDLLYEDFFRRKAEENNNFTFLESISRQQSTPDGSKMYVQERMLERTDSLYPLLEDPETLVYICGLEGMELGIYRALLAMDRTEYFSGIPERLSSEDFGELSDRDDRLDGLRPNKERLKVEVY